MNPTKTLKFNLTGFIFVFLTSCGPCRYLDCISSTYDFSFQIVDENTERNLVFGPDAIFDYKEIRLYSIIGSDTVIYPTRVKGLDLQSQDKLIIVEVFPPTGVLFLEYPDKSRDTLSLTFSQTETQCCGSVVTMTSITRNGKELYQDLYEPIRFPR